MDIRICTRMVAVFVTLGSPEVTSLITTITAIITIITIIKGAERQDGCCRVDVENPKKHILSQEQA